MTRALIDLICIAAITAALIHITGLISEAI